MSVGTELGVVLIIGLAAAFELAWLWSMHSTLLNNIVAYSDPRKTVETFTLTSA